jgi:hypothetical protein
LHIFVNSYPNNKWGLSFFQNRKNVFHGKMAGGLSLSPSLLYYQLAREQSSELKCLDAEGEKSLGKIR